MRVYTAHVDPASLDRDHGIVVVKEGMCWPAFFFSFLWAVWHRLWGTAVLLLIAVSAVDAFSYLVGADETTAAIFSLGLAVYVGASANDWRRRALARRGYRLAGVVVAPSAEQAVQRLVERSEEGVLAHGVPFGEMGRP